MEIIETKQKNNIFSSVKLKTGLTSPNHVLQSWEKGVDLKVETDVTKGLRLPQFGALNAIRAFWTVEEGVATVVMPTGTGKTETILTTIIAEKVQKTLIIVPSDLLRKQIYESARTLKVLFDIGVLKKNEHFPPNVYLYATGTISTEDFIKKVEESNIIVTTMSLANRLSEERLNVILESVEVLFIDEAHHVSSKTWNRFKSKCRNIRVIQFTATPFRADNKRIDGKIIYNFPLQLAQKLDYFKPIELIRIEEYDLEKADYKIAEKSVELLGMDLEEGFDHVILVRASSIPRAEQLYSEIYHKYYQKYNPVLITSAEKPVDKVARFQKIKDKQSRIIIGVDMFGEGIDIPNLKIAAIHDKYKSLPITLQFIGRFARSKSKVGKAKIVTNIADEKITEELAELYERDADWNYLLPKKSNQNIDKEVSFQEFLESFETSLKDGIDLSQIKMKISCRAFRTSKLNWDIETINDVFDMDRTWYFEDKENEILIVVEGQERSVSWTNQQDFQNYNWHLYVYYFNKEKQYVAIHATDKSKGYRLLKKLFQDDMVPIKEEAVFRSFYGMNRLTLATVGLNQAIDGPISYKMFTGPDVREGIELISTANSYKSNIFGVGYDGSGQVSIGCSRKGTIWSRWVESIDYWKDWVNQTYEKVLDNGIQTDEFLKGVLIPKQLKRIPPIKAYRIDWPREMDYEITNTISIENISGKYDIRDVDIFIDMEASDEEKIRFRLVTEKMQDYYDIYFDERGFQIKGRGDYTTTIQVNRRERVLLQDFFQENPPIVWLVNGSHFYGDTIIELGQDRLTEFPDSNIIQYNWNKLGVNIKVESQIKKLGESIRKNSIQYRMIDMLKETSEHTIIFDDDGSGEVADIVAIEEDEKTVSVSLHHCKYSSSEQPGQRVGDLYEVCGQTEKSVKWHNDLSGLLNQLIRRELVRINEGNRSRIEKGTLQDLKDLLNRIKYKRGRIKLFVVQPGVIGNKLTEDMHTILSVTHSYCMDTYSVPLQLICSE